MGVYNKEMKIPESCKVCPFVEDCEHTKPKGRITRNGIIVELEKDDCPLVEVPEPHGRLIDIDFILPLCATPASTYIAYVDLFQFLKHACPTVIDGSE